MFDAETWNILFYGPWGRVAAFLWGAVWGSFFNVVIARLPEGESVVQPASHCRQCKTTIAWYDNVPLLSFLLLRGQCRHCGARFSARYFFTELLICLLTVWMHQMFIIDGTGELGLRLAQFVISSAFCGVLVALAFIDLDTMYLPDVLTKPGIVAAVALSLLMELPRWWDGPVGAVAGYLVIRAIADGYKLIKKRQGMGYGDAKLLAMIGGLLGWQALFPTLFLASFQGSVIGISALLLVRRRSGREDQAAAAGEVEDVGDNSAADEALDAERPGEPVADQLAEDQEPEDEEPPSSSIRHAKIPFGPFLSLAALEVLIFKEHLARLIPFPW